MRSTDPRYHDPLLGVAFDLDGTLVISRHDFPKMRRRVIEIGLRHGVPDGLLSPKMNIPALFDTALKELERAGATESVRFRFEAEAGRAVDEIELEALPNTVVRPGAERILQRLQARGYQLGLLTRSSATFAETALKQTGLAKYLPHLRTRTDAGPAKPDPSALLSLLKSMAVPPSRAIFIGDHLLDAECAARAHVRFYAILPVEPGSLGTDTQRFLAAGATAVAPDFETLERQLSVLAPPAP